MCIRDSPEIAFFGLNVRLSTRKEGRWDVPHIVPHISHQPAFKAGWWEIPRERKVGCAGTYFSVPPTAASAERGEASCRLNAAGNRGNITVVSLYHCTFNVHCTAIEVTLLYSIQQINADLTTHPPDKSPEVSVSITFESLLQQDQEYTYLQCTHNICTVSYTHLTLPTKA